MSQQMRVVLMSVCTCACMALLSSNNRQQSIQIQLGIMTSFLSPSEMVTVISQTPFSYGQVSEQHNWVWVMQPALPDYRSPVTISCPADVWVCGWHSKWVETALPMGDVKLRSPSPESSAGEDHQLAPACWASCRHQRCQTSLLWSHHGLQAEHCLSQHMLARIQHASVLGLQFGGHK